MQSVVAYYGRSSSGFVNEILLPHSGNKKIHPFLFFLMKTSEQHKGRFLTVVTFWLFLLTQFVSS